ncbi:isoprenoid synthase domain-containing protein [Lasiosphaeris hirsuta]|uniref:Isoprenoid synthase domain-containing protein n=1 Tax=Lasiosphaeris hirsuta TaxID=260670 RepID=A0AA40A390_9PEZI|nr:isoprenoid synthase domain-containing protein [Lasiosphaeris hirsuta]
MRLSLEDKGQAAVPDLGGQLLRIPNLTLEFAGWKQGVNPSYEQVRQNVDKRLGELIRGNEKVLGKARAGDLGLFASSWFPDVDYEDLETAALFSIWAFFWDDAIDGSSDASVSGLSIDGASNDTVARGIAEAEKYRDQSLSFVRFHLLGGVESGTNVEPKAPNVIFCCDEEALRSGFLGSIETYMEACVAELKWRLSGKLPANADEFYQFRLQTSAVEMMLDLCGLSQELTGVRVCSNKISIIINELFSLKKELKDGAPLNLVPITMRALNLNLDAATQVILNDLHSNIRDFEQNANVLRESTTSEHEDAAVESLERLIGAYQALVTCVLHFSIKSPRYGILKDRQDDGSFVIAL